MISFKDFCKNNNISLDTLSNFDIERIVNELKIPNFRGVYMKDELPKKIKVNECGIVNLQNSDENGSHWICYYKKGKLKYYFDSYGLDLPNELKSYLKSPIYCSTFEIQKLNTKICGQLCTYMLYYLEKGFNFIDILLSLMKEIHGHTGGDLNSDIGLVSNIAELAEFFI